MSDYDDNEYAFVGFTCINDKKIKKISESYNENIITESSSKINKYNNENTITESYNKNNKYNNKYKKYNNKILFIYFISIITFINLSFYWSRFY